MKHTVRIRMGAPYWDITVRSPLRYTNGQYIQRTVDLRLLDKEQQRKAMFEVTKFVRLRREAAAA